MIFEAYLKLVYSSVKRKKLRSWLTLVGILIGVSAVVCLIGLSGGLRETVMSQFNVLNPDVITIEAQGLGQGPPGEGVKKPLREYYVEDIEKIKGVDFAVGRIVEEGKLSFKGSNHFSFVGSFPKDVSSKKFQKVFQLDIEKGNMLEESDGYKVVVGNDLGGGGFFRERVRLRDKIKINGEDFKVKGVLEKKGSFIFDHTVIIPEKNMREMYGVNDSYDVIAVKANIENIELVKERLENYLREERNVDEGKEDFNVQTAREALQNLDGILFGIQIFVAIIAGISIVVGGIGISNTMYTSVLERTKEIGIMKSVGAKNKDVFNLFLIESGTLGFFGGLLGVMLGGGLAYLLSFLGEGFVGEGLIPVSIGGSLIVGVLIFSFFVGVVAGLIPAMRASKLKPVEAVRYAK
tara:strand:+ start:2320 stop:3540 length:1221 start_codon:yes stop_codon:yes gene_type:complete